MRVWILILLFASVAYGQTSGPVTIDGQSNVTISGKHITSTAGDCLTITNSTNITVQQSEIGPCVGNAIVITGGSGVKVLDNYVHSDSTVHAGCCDTHDGITASGGGSLTIIGNVIAHNEANIEVNGTAGVDVEGNFLLNPQDSDPSVSADSQSRGQNFQCWSGCSTVTVKNNYALSSTAAQYGAPENQEDSINFGITNGIVVDGNYIQGGHSPSGCGLIVDDSANSAQFTNNVMVDNGQCGIGIADGTNQTATGNKIWERNPINGGGNTAIYVWKQYSAPCGPVTLANNIASAVDTSGNSNTYFDGGGCAPVTMTNNIFDSIAASMPIPAPPSIPPKPFACAIASPWTNNKLFSACSGGIISKPNPPTGLKATAN